MQSKSPNTHAYFRMGGGWAPNLCVYGCVFYVKGLAWIGGRPSDDDAFNRGTMSNATFSP